MSKIGRMPIALNKVKITFEENKVFYKGKESQGDYVVPKEFSLVVKDDSLFISPKEEYKSKKKINMVWGLHRALLNNLIGGADKLFEKSIKIEGLGFKAELQGSTIIFSLGYSHKIEYCIPEGVTVGVDKSKQNITIRSAKKDLLGHVGATIKSFRPVEPYKGKGIYYSDEKIVRKKGKTK